MNPIFIWAPTARCGTTLLQRLITSGKRTLCFGEWKMFTTWVPLCIVEAGGNKDELNDAARRLAEGEDFWCVNAIPDIDGIINASRDYLLNTHDVFHRTAKGHGYEGYGVKAPFHLCGATAALVKQLIPESRHIFMVRRILPVVQSYMGRGWEVNEQLVKQWNIGVKQIAALPDDPGLLLMSYDVLMSDTDAQLDRLDIFCGAQVDRSLMGKKINIFEALKEDGYVKPSKLSEKQRRQISETAHEGMKELMEIEEKCAVALEQSTWLEYGSSKSQKSKPSAQSTVDPEAVSSPNNT